MFIVNFKFGAIQVFSRLSPEICSVLAAVTTSDQRVLIKGRIVAKIFSLELRFKLGSLDFIVGDADHWATAA